MTRKRTPTELLEGAYAIATPADSLAYYHDFAEHYDAQFAQRLGYIYPRLIAECFHRHATAEDTPVADIGCGTGLVAEVLGLAQDRIHGFDISPEMLEKSRAKNLYADVHPVDLTKPLMSPRTHPMRLFGAIVSAGTFTHGHLGPEPLENLLDLAQHNAFFCIGVNARHFKAKGFSAVLERLTLARKITAPKVETVPIFSKPDTPHGKDTAHLLMYRKI